MIKNIHPILNVELKNTHAKQLHELLQSDFDEADVIIIGVSSAGVDWYIDASSGNGSNYTYMHVDQHAFVLVTPWVFAYEMVTRSRQMLSDRLCHWISK